VTGVAQLALLLVALIWGWTFVLVKESLEATGTFSFLFYRFLLASVVLALLFGGRLRARVPGRVWLQGALVGLVLFCGYWFQTWGLVYTTATKSGFITGLSVVLVPVLGVRLFKARIVRRAWTGALLSALGLGLIVFGAGGAQVAFNPGDALTLLCALSFALHILLVGRYARPENYVFLLLVQIGTVTVLSALGVSAAEGWRWPEGAALWRAIALTAVLATALAFWIQNRFQPHSTAAQTAVIFSSEPAFAALFGVWLLGERLAALQWAGAASILIAMLVAQWPARRRALSRPPG